MISDIIQKQIADALRVHDQVRLDTLRMLLSALDYAKIDKRENLTGEEEVAVVKKEAKKRQDAIEAFGKIQITSSHPIGSVGKIQERIKQEQEELKILQEFLPEQMTDSQLLKIVNEVMEEMRGEQNKGEIIREVIRRTKGKADGGRVSDIVGKKLR
jgi:hypothetical protein